MSLGKILIIDSDAIACFITRMALEHSGYTGELVFIDNAQEALLLLGKESFDLILLELHTPDLEGSQFFERLAQIRLVREELIPVIIVSTDVQYFMDKVKALHSDDIKAYITKPFKTDHVDIIRSVTGELSWQGLEQ
jgi:DNA-binding response OmpR family regulator